jgi:hypothetical protein
MASSVKHLMSLFWSPQSAWQPSQTPTGHLLRRLANWVNRFYEVGQCLFALLLGLVGGWVIVYVFRKRQRMLSNRN